MGGLSDTAEPLVRAPDTWQTLRKHHHDLNLNETWTGSQGNELFPSFQVLSEPDPCCPPLTLLCVGLASSHELLPLQEGQLVLTTANWPALVPGTSLQLDRKASGPISDQGARAGHLKPTVRCLEELP